MVATMTAASGVRPEKRVLRFQNFSNPMSAPKPLSVTWYSEVARPSLSAMIDDCPMAMLAKGPA
jgi:hypothetical protein